MPSGVIRLRESKRALKKMPREFHAIVDNSGLRGTGTRHTNTDVNVGSDLRPSNQSRPFKTTRDEYPMAPQPISNEEPVRGEGPKRERHKSQL